MAKSNRDRSDPPVSGADPQEFEQLFERFVHPVNNFFSKRGLSREECQDLTQETFLGACKGMERFRNESSEGTWLFTIAANVWRNELRRRSTEKRDAKEVSIDSTDGVGELPALDQTDPLAAMVTKEQRQWFREALQSLPDQMRRCLIMRVRQELKYREIAALMQISINTVKSTISQARDRLQEKLVELEQDKKGAMAKEA
jgi:RNA polymerase sigma-70 factor (ECF subfamily)